MTTLNIDMRDVDDIKQALEDAIAYMRKNDDTHYTKENRILFADLIRCIHRIESTKKNGPN